MMSTALASRCTHADHGDTITDEHGAASYAPIPQSIRQARHDALRTLSSWGIEQDTIERAVLVISELATNAITHSASCCVRVWLRRLGRDEVEVSVSDRQRQVRGEDLRPCRAAADDETGRGLLIVHTIADRWRAEADDDGTTVYAVLGPNPTRTALFDV
jgi:anti-sigma regulatory factor (Ser/Thr protein kinase)